MFIATRARRFTENNLLFTFLLLGTAIFVFVGGYALFLQAQRVTSQVPLSRNWKAWFIIGCYSTLALVSLILTGRRARVLTLKLKRIPEKEINAPPSVEQFIRDEYWRTAAIAYASQPRGSMQKGWGSPGNRSIPKSPSTSTDSGSSDTSHEGVNFRRTILDTVPVIDAHARIIAPRLPVLRPHVRMTRHLRDLAELFPLDRFSCLQKYDLVVQIARYSTEEPSEAEFQRGMQAYQELLEILAAYRDDQSEQH